MVSVAKTGKAEAEAVSRSGKGKVQTGVTVAVSHQSSADWFVGTPAHARQISGATSILVSGVDPRGGPERQTWVARVGNKAGACGERETELLCRDVPWYIPGVGLQACSSPASVAERKAREVGPEIQRHQAGVRLNYQAAI